MKKTEFCPCENTLVPLNYVRINSSPASYMSNKFHAFPREKYKKNLPDPDHEAARFTHKPHKARRNRHTPLSQY